jgi:hypothetical protein
MSWNNNVLNNSNTNDTTDSHLNYLDIFNSSNEIMNKHYSYPSENTYDNYSSSENTIYPFVYCTPLSVPISNTSNISNESNTSNTSNERNESNTSNTSNISNESNTSNISNESNTSNTSNISNESNESNESNFEKLVEERFKNVLNCSDNDILLYKIKHLENALFISQKMTRDYVISLTYHYEQKFINTNNKHNEDMNKLKNSLESIYDKYGQLLIDNKRLINKVIEYEEYPQFKKRKR